MSKVTNPGQTDFDRSQLSSEEEDFLDAYFARGLADYRQDGNTLLADALSAYKDEARVAAEAAKANFAKHFDGQEPSTGKFGVDLIQSGYFGYNDWANFGEFAADGDDVLTWLDNSAPDNLAGAGGQEGPLSVGESATHLIVGVGSYADEPVADRFSFRFNDQPMASISTEYQFQNSDLGIKFLDAPKILLEDDDVYAEVYAGEDGEEAPFLVGFSFIEGREYRRLDPANMVGDGRIVSE